MNSLSSPASKSGRQNQRLKFIAAWTASRLMSCDFLLIRIFARPGNLCRAWTVGFEQDGYLLRPAPEFPEYPPRVVLGSKD